MTEQGPSPLEMLLQVIAQSAPGAWYPHVHARERGVDVADVMEALEWLWLEGLIEKAPGSKETGPGVQLTAFGQVVLNDPEALARLRVGEPVRPGDRGASIRQSLYKRGKGTVTRLLLIANFAVFGYCLWLANQHPGLLKAYIGMQGRQDVVERVLEAAGGVSALDIIRGQWWRLLTACFVHAGLLHILMNMYGLWAVGRFAEQAWGGWRYLVIYLIAGWGGSTLALAWVPTQKVGDFHVVITGVGASGALCGILAATGVWVILYGKHLPRGTAGRLRSQMVVNGILIVFMSLLPGVSGVGHLGGALLGGAAAFVLHFERFGSGLVRLVALGMLPLLPWGSYAHLQVERVRSEGWHWAEFLVFSRDQLKPIDDTFREAINRYQKDVKPIFYDRAAERREPEEVEAALAVLEEEIESLEALIRLLERAGPYYSAEVKTALSTALTYARQRAEVYRETARCLRAGEKWSRAEEKALTAQWAKLVEIRKEWELLFREILIQHRNRT